MPSLFGVGLETWPFAQEAATRLAKSLGAELFTIAGAGHTAHVSHPQQFAEFVRRSTRLPTADDTAGRGAKTLEGTRMTVPLTADGLEALTHTHRGAPLRYHKAMGVVRSQRWR